MRRAMPTPALLKKLQALGADASAVPGLKRAMDGKAEALFYESTVQGRDAGRGPAEGAGRSLAKLPIPKVMTYQLADGWTDVKFVRPAHGLVALHGDDVVPIEALGLQAGRTTHGHRFEAAVDPVTLRRCRQLRAATLANDGAVIAELRRARAPRSCASSQPRRQGRRRLACHRRRRAARRSDRAGRAPQRAGLQLRARVPRSAAGVPHPHDEGQPEVLPAARRAGQAHQPFLVVSNISPHDASAVIGGNERVVRPRLADAKFFFDQDRKKTLESRVEGLARWSITTSWARRASASSACAPSRKVIAAQLGDATSSPHRPTQAARLAKADLLTDMVGEFPELQGTMGRYYALHDGLGDGHRRCDRRPLQAALRRRRAAAQRRRPRGGAGRQARDAGRPVRIGNLPTGDKDPFALRRHALGVIRMLIEKDLPLGLDALLQDAARAVPASASRFRQRQGHAHRLHLRPPGRQPARAGLQRAGSRRRAGAAAAAPGRRRQAPGRRARLRRAARSAALAAANKRIGNILKKAEARRARERTAAAGAAEKALHAATAEVAPAGQRASSKPATTPASLQTLAALRAPVDAFFDGVMVNAEQADLRLNRLGLLMRCCTAMNRVAQLEPGSDPFDDSSTGLAMKLVILDRDGTINVRQRRFRQERHRVDAAARRARSRRAAEPRGLARGGRVQPVGPGPRPVRRRSLNAMHAKMHKMLAAVGGNRCGVLLPAQPRRRLRVPQAEAGPVRADRRALRHRPEGHPWRATACATCRRARRPAASRTWCSPARARPASAAAASRISGEHDGAREPRRLCRLAACARSAGCTPGELSDGVYPFRSVLHALWMLVTVVPWGIIMVRQFDLEARHSAVLDGRAGSAGHRRRARAAGHQTRVTGMENLPTDQLPAILLVKHQSTLETFLMPTLMPHPLAYVFKKELIYVPFFGWAMARLDMIHIDRSQRAQAFNKVVNQGRAARAGHLDHHVPRRHAHSARPEGHLQERRHAPGLRDRRAGDPDCRHLGQGLAAQGVHQAPGRGRCVDRPAISSVGRKPDELMREVEAWIEAEMHRLDPEAYR
jgi:glycyl-tRNA synthetase beta chain